VESAFRIYAEQHRAYSTAQLKYLKNFFDSKGSYWFNIIDDSLLLSQQTGQELLALSPNSQRPPDFTNFERSPKRIYQSKIASTLSIDLKSEDLLYLTSLFAPKRSRP
jgi:hypothetical protein